MDRITQSERVLMHLYSFRHLDPSERYGIPFDVTQDGIGEAIGISRSHASLILGRMSKEGLVTNGQATVGSVVGGTTVRKVYFLTQKGLSECARLLEVHGDGSGPDSVFPRNINHCRSDVFDSLRREDRDLLGCLMVLRVPVRVSQLPRGRDHPLVPVDTKGFVHLKPATREWYIGRAGETEVRRWHSLAADWCSDHGVTAKERLLHLILGGRWREAARLAWEWRFWLMDDPDAELMEALDRMDSATGDGSLSPFISFCFTRLGDTARARKAMERSSMEPGERGALEAEILLAEGRKDMALDMALECYGSDVSTCMALGKCMAANGRHSEAVVYLRCARRRMNDAGCLFRLDEALEWEGESYMVLGEHRLASRLVGAAAVITRDSARSRALRTRSEVMASKDPVAPECVQVRDIQVPYVRDAPL